MREFWLLTVFLPLAYYLNAGEGLNCYICSSETDVNCTSTNMSPNHSKVCPPLNGRDAILCRKISQQLKFKDKKKFTSVRECGYRKGHLSCYFFKSPKLAVQETCECMKDNCNHGTTCQPCDVMIIIMFVFAMVRFLDTI